ncbi:MAG: nucleotide exchange factor GrpE [Terrimicrobiaceae bacterium]
MNTENSSEPNEPASEGAGENPTAASAVEVAEPVTPDPAEEAAKFRDLAMRTAADFDNFRKRAAREREDSIRYANASLIERLLPVLDSFELGLEAARSAEGNSPVVAGFEMVKRQLDDFLKDSGVEVIDAVGATFDPNHHDAMGSEFSAEVPEGGVVRQLRRGYKLRDRVLRAASVFVSKGPAQE